MFWASKKELEEELMQESKQEVPEIEIPVKEETEEEYENSDETGSEKRFHNRVAVYEEKDLPKIKHHVWWFVHNCIAHPMIGVFPSPKTFWFHDWTSKKINGE